MNTVLELQHINKLWQRRLDVVLAMEGWMATNLSQYVFDRGGRVVGRNPHENVDKGRASLYCHLLLGKTLYPGGSDPLFTDDEYLFDAGVFRDISLQKQLDLDRGGEFTSGVGGIGRNVSAFLAEMRGRKASINVDIESASAPVLSAVHTAYVPESAVAVIDRLRHELSSRYTLVIIDELIIGLILRYRCIGGFSSNQHASIQGQWGKAFGKMIECFASPLNHVFSDYYSVFEEDGVFGSRGNLLRSVNSETGVLTGSGEYEMNPPFEETILDKAASIVCNTFSAPKCSVRLVMFTPNWEDSGFFVRLNALIGSLGSGNACMYRPRLRYDHVDGGDPPVQSFVFVFVGRGCTPGEAAAFRAKCEGVISSSIASGSASSGGWAYRGGGRGRGPLPPEEFREIRDSVAARKQESRGSGSRGGGVRSLFTSTLERVDNLISCSDALI
jgi:hypothetical protein